MSDGATTNGLISVSQAAKPVRVILEQIGIDSADTQAQLLSLLSSSRPIVGVIPGNMQRHRGAGTRQAVHQGGVGKLLVKRAGRPTLSKDLEARARIAVSP